MKGQYQILSQKTQPEKQDGLVQIFGSSKQGRAIRVLDSIIVYRIVRYDTAVVPRRRDYISLWSVLE